MPQSAQFSDSRASANIDVASVSRVVFILEKLHLSGPVWLYYRTQGSRTSRTLGPVPLSLVCPLRVSSGEASRGDGKELGDTPTLCFLLRLLTSPLLVFQVCVL